MVSFPIFFFTPFFCCLPHAPILPSSASLLLLSSPHVTTHPHRSKISQKKYSCLIVAFISTPLEDWWSVNKHLFPQISHHWDRSKKKELFWFFMFVKFSQGSMLKMKDWRRSLMNSEKMQSSSVGSENNKWINKKNAKWINWYYLISRHSVFLSGFLSVSLNAYWSAQKDVRLRSAEQTAQAWPLVFNPVSSC